MDLDKLENRLAILDDLQASCTHCGLCLEACSTFQATGWEHESPRGRIRLASNWLDGKIAPHSQALETFDHCLGCHACETICPTSTSYGKIRQLVQELRAELLPKKEIKISRKTYRHWIQMAYRLGSLLWRHYGRKRLFDGSLPLSSPGSYLKKKGKRTQKPDAITLAIGCLQDLYGHEVIEAAIKVLNQLGYSVHLSKNQPCCGAILERLVHGGQAAIIYADEQKKALKKQNKRVKKFLGWLSSPTYFLSNGCQSFVLRQLSIQKREGVGDLYELILQTIRKKKIKFVLNESLTVYYQPYCGQAKKREGDTIYSLLNCIEGLVIKELPNPMACCGGYGGESLFDPPYAHFLLQHKLSILPTNALLVVASSDCQFQFLMHAQSHSLKVVYPIQLLAKATIYTQL